MDNYINYLSGFVDGLSADCCDQTAKNVSESRLNALISEFEVARNSYLSDLDRLRKVYKPVFEDLLASIKKEKQVLEKLTGSKVIFCE